MEGKTLFIRDDAERAQWTQEELTLEIEFPHIAGKSISTGQRILFRNPATDEPQIYEVKQAKSLEPDHYQSVTAENICISELSDDHIDNQEITDKSASDALTTVLSGTLWRVGTVGVNPVSSLSVPRGSVWQAVLQIKSNWNVYIEPRVSIAANGTITRYLDIISTAGVWNGLRLSIDKNMLNPSVTYDDSELVTALYGYGGTTTATSQGEESKEITFRDVVWQKTADHPAKPAGKIYLEDPDATAAYGRNGRARFGFYQNTDILDPNVLLQKTWESLKQSSKPAISIDGTVEDLHGMGYADVPIRLHDIAMVEVLPAGYKDRLQVIRLTTDLLDPTQTSVTIGAYIPNIIYINNKNQEYITGERGGSGNGGGRNKSPQPERSEYETEFKRNNREIVLRAYQNDLDDLDNDVKLMDTTLTITAEGLKAEVTDRRNADEKLNTSITQTAKEVTIEVNRAKKAEGELSGKITVNANKIALVVTETGQGYTVNSASIVAGINSGHGSYIKLAADTINLSGYVTASELSATNAKINNLTSGRSTAAELNATRSHLGNCEAPILRSYDFTYQSHSISIKTVTIGGTTYHLLGY
jgi:phage minor structural protein